MTDVEARTPNKRRLSEKKTPASAKKAKVTPQKQENKGNKQNNVPNSNGKFKKGKKNSESENGSPKKLKPFVGTSKTAPAKEQKTEENKKPQQNKEKGEGKKTRRGVFATIKEKLSSNEKGVALQSIGEKIKAIESRSELTRSAKKKLKLLYRLQKAAGGEGRPLDDKPVQKTQKKEGKQKKGSEVAKAPQANLGKKDQNKAPAKGQLNKKLVKVETKVTKKTQQIVQEESSDDDDEESDNELEEEDSDDEVGEEVEGEDDEVEGEDDGEEEEESDEDESEEEDSPPPQVSNKRQKKK